MKILVPIKQVSALDEDFEFRDDGRDVDPDFLIHDLNEWDNFSLEEAMRLKEGPGGEGIEVVVVTVGPDEAEEELRKCLAKGADRALRVWSDELEEADAIAVANVLAAVARKEAPDMIFIGVQGSDDATSSVGIAVAGLLELPHAAVVSSLDYAPGSNSATVKRELEGGAYAAVKIDCPAVLTIQLGINTPRYASLRGIKQAAQREIEVLDPAALGLAADIGASASASRVRRMYVPEKGRAEMLEGTPAEQAARIAQIIKEFKGEA